MKLVRFFYFLRRGSLWSALFFWIDVNWRVDLGRRDELRLHRWVFLWRGLEQLHDYF